MFVPLKQNDMDTKNTMVVINAQNTLRNNIPNDVLIINKSLKEKGYDCYLVGGSVRDAMFNIEPKDFDLVTNAFPDEIMECLGSHFKTEPRGVEFGIIVVKGKDDEYEIATYRSDISANTGNLMDDTVKLGVTIEEDLQRRDFTCNALLYNIDDNHILDYVGGKQDIFNGILRTVGNANERFTEDSTRKLRAIRFASRLDLRLHDDILKSIRNNPELLCNKERIEKELEKIFDTQKNENVRDSSSLLFRLGLSEHIFEGCELNYMNSFEVSDLTSFIASSIKPTTDNINNLKKTIKTAEIVNGVKLLWMLDGDYVVADAHRMKKSTHLTKEVAETFTNKDLSFLFGDKINNIIRNLNKEAIDIGLEGKEIGQYTKNKLQEWK